VLVAALASYAQTAEAHSRRRGQALLRNEETGGSSSIASSSDTSSSIASSSDSNSKSSSGQGGSSSSFSNSFNPHPFIQFVGANPARREELWAWIGNEVGGGVEFPMLSLSTADIILSAEGALALMYPSHRLFRTIVLAALKELKSHPLGCPTEKSAAKKKNTR
jgi:hypothetical protein